MSTVKRLVCWRPATLRKTMTGILAPLALRGKLDKPGCAFLAQRSMRDRIDGDGGRRGRESIGRHGGSGGWALSPSVSAVSASASFSAFLISPLFLGPDSTRGRGERTGTSVAARPVSLPTSRAGTSLGLRWSAANQFADRQCCTTASAVHAFWHGHRRKCGAIGDWVGKPICR